MVLVLRQLCNPHADFRLPFVAVSFRLGKKDDRKRSRVLQLLLDVNTIAFVPLGNQLLLRCEDTGAVVVRIGIDLPAELVFTGRSFFGPISFVGGHRTLDVDILRDTVGGDASQKGTVPPCRWTLHGK